MPTPESKFNPLQRLAYFSLLAFIFPVQMISGFLLWGVDRWPAIERLPGGLWTLALLHTAGAFAMLGFVILHLYMATTGRTLLSHLKAMLSGWADEEP